MDHDQIMTVIRPSRRSYRIGFDVERPPFDNVKVRQAIVTGIDRSTFIHIPIKGGRDDGTAGFGYAPGSLWELPQEQLCSVSGWCVSEDMEATRAEARSILEEEGFDFEKTYLLGLYGGETIATHLQYQLRLLGIETDLCVDEPFIGRPRCLGNLELFATWTPIPADDPNAGVENYLTSHINCNPANDDWIPYTICESSIMDLLNQARVELEPEQRLTLAHDIELALMKQYQQFPITWWQEGAAFWPEVRGYVHFPLRSGSFLKFMHLWIDPVHRNDTGYAGQATGVPGGT